MRTRTFRDDEAFGDSVTSQDALYNGNGALLFLLVLALVLIAVSNNKSDAPAVPPGNIAVEITWSSEIDADIDLWVRGPRGEPVGYSNKGGEIYNLLRDDLGNLSKDDLVNFETTYSRGIPLGQHCVNVHLFSNRSGILPIPVKVLVRITRGVPGEETKGGVSPVLVGDVELSEKGQERNIFCFSLVGDGELSTEKDGVFQSDAIHLRAFSKS